jgi:hypothetical protein
MESRNQSDESSSSICDWEFWMFWNCNWPLVLWMLLCMLIHVLSSFRTWWVPFKCLFDWNVLFSSFHSLDCRIFIFQASVCTAFHLIWALISAFSVLCQANSGGWPSTVIAFQQSQWFFERGRLCEEPLQFSTADACFIGFLMLYKVQLLLFSIAIDNVCLMLYKGLASDISIISFLFMF